VVRVPEFDKPIIARVHGHAPGFGRPSLLSDGLMVDHARFGGPHVNAGFPAADATALMSP
jgi:enoyl-CoA hydratase/carnithine racemase